jgi:hypothetical protein
MTQLCQCGCERPVGVAKRTDTGEVHRSSVPRLLAATAWVSLMPARRAMPFRHVSDLRLTRIAGVKPRPDTRVPNNGRSLPADKSHAVQKER